MKLTSPIFEKNGKIPDTYTCDGENINPALWIEDVPAEARSLALIVADPDAPKGIFTHWVVWNIDPGTKEIEEDSVPEGARQGLNDFRTREYDGPCPPSGAHRYFFRLYALDTKLELKENAKKADLEKAMKGHILAETELMGRYSRKKVPAGR